jgi:hypothetical protein
MEGSEPAPGAPLGHGEARAHLAAGQRREPALALRRIGDPLEHRHVALVGRGAVQRERAEQGVAGLLEDHGLPAHVEPEAAELAGDVRGEDARLARRGLERLAQLLRRAVARGAVLLLERHDDVAHEGARAGLEVFELGREVQGHGGETNGR